MTFAITFTMVPGLLPSPDLTASCTCGWQSAAWDDSLVRVRAFEHLTRVHDVVIDRVAQFHASVDARDSSTSAGRT